ncbi:MAG: M56 family metallopeptidase [Lachnospiraceae bacterium]|nr:M56 family metallopeptidase [Lachnospiraceae bacterium]
MNYILTMSLSGSCMLLLYWGQKYFLRKYIAKKWQYFLLKITVLYYLLPLPFVGIFYRNVFSLTNERNIYYHDEKVVWQLEEGIVLSTGYQNEIVMFGIWLLGISVVLLMQWKRYRRCRKRLVKYGKEEVTDETVQVLENLKHKLSIRKKVILITGEEHTFTIGWQKPVVVWQEPPTLEEKKMLLEHELYHVKRGDLLWRLLGGVVTWIHWFNPLVYLCVKELEQLAEETCDELVIADRSKEDRYQYAKLLVQYAGKSKEESRWEMALASSKKKLKVRVELIMKYEKPKKKWNGVLAVLLCGGMVLLNSMTALAYEEIHVIEASGNITSEGLAESDFLFTPDGEEDVWRDMILYDEQFVDEEGNVYPAKGTKTVCATGDHIYVSGIGKVHDVNAEGSCVTCYYGAQRCVWCGDVVWGENINRIAFDKCIH